jgi:hypothetical protein
MDIYRGNRLFRTCSLILDDGGFVCRKYVHIQSRKSAELSPPLNTAGETINFSLSLNKNAKVEPMEGPSGASGRKR